MALGWKKLGQVYVARGEADWRHSHAYLPTPVRHDADTLRIYTAFLDAQQYGRIGYVDVDVANPTRVKKVSESPLLNLGAPGSFDDSGVAPCSVVSVGDERWLYYQGFQRTVQVPYVIYSGLAVSTDGGETFTRASQTPILDRCDSSRLVRSAPFVLPPAVTGEPWRVWTCAGTSAFTRQEGRWAPIYGIGYAESTDGRRWAPEDIRVIPPAWPSEYGVSRPCVWRTAHGFAMLYSVRSEAHQYRMGCAHSPDGVAWERADEEVGIDVSRDGWDSEMVAFPAIIPTEHGVYLFYNGNGNGRTGFGVAVATEISSGRLTLPQSAPTSQPTVP